VEPIKPMEPKSSEIIPEGSDWLAQVKWDGVRILTYFDGKEARLFNRKINERTRHYPEIADIKSFCKADSVILDGEVIALGKDGKPSFNQVLRRDLISRMEKIEIMRRNVPITYMIFDVPFYNGEWINDSPLQERIDLLNKIIIPNPCVQLVTSHEDGKTLFEVIKKQGMEGIMMKKIDSPYLIGQKKDLWVKVKNYRDVIAVIGGFTLREGIVNAILLGMYDKQGKLFYIGHSGTGKMAKSEWRELTERLQPLEMKERPFVNKPERHKEAKWILPKITVKIKFAEWTPDMILRQPSIQGFVNIPPEECLLNEEL
jgi:bifunctional non-homologous end joining protein LigD